jgi:pimeloyl-ACP methyl ester carboxylesterase
MVTRTPLAIDRTIKLTINGSNQRIRLCASRAGLPPLLVVQGGPALPLLHEVSKFQRLLNLEQDFLVAYWEQRGCGDAPQRDARSVSLPQQVEDLRSVLQWVHAETKQRVLVLGISIGGTIVLRAVEHETDRVKAVVAVSPDAQTTCSDGASYAFLQEQALRRGSGRLRRRVRKLGQPPYVDTKAFQRRVSLLADLGTIEYGRTFPALLREMLFAMIRTYGVIGTVRALRNLDLVQRQLLPEIDSVDLFANPPRIAIPVHYVFGEQDALTPASLAERMPAAIAAPAGTAVRVANAGHMVHFDRPDIVRSIVMSAFSPETSVSYPVRASLQ